VSRRAVPKWVAGVLLVVLGAPVSHSAAQTSQDIFATHKTEILTEGVRELGGFVFATQIAANQRRADQASPAAVRRMLQWQVEKSAGWSMPDSAVRRAALFAAPACLPSPFDSTTIETVAMVGRPDGTVMTVHSLRADRLRDVRLSVTDLVACLRTRLDAGRATLLDALLVAELDPDGVSQAEFSGWLDRLCGPGFAATRTGQWPAALDGIEDWRRAADLALKRGESLSGAVNPTPLARCEAMMDPGECLMLLGRRANDAHLLNRSRVLLLSQGWTRSAAMLPQRGAACGGLVDPGQSRVAALTRHMVATSAPFLQLLLSDGTAEIAMSRVAAPSYEEARIAFNGATPESLQRATSLLAQSFVTTPDVPTAVLLSAALLALDDPAIAFPVARLAFRQSPEHPYAGVNMLRAAKACGRREIAAAMIEEVKAKASLDAWGKSQLAEIESWLATPPSPTASPQ
jgi:hypothetical protein